MKLHHADCINEKPMRKKHKMLTCPGNAEDDGARSMLKAQGLSHIGLSQN
jgi:hypothetical protein